MSEIITRQNRQIYIVSQRELRDPLSRGEYVRAYCHIHGSDHQRSLSINRRTAWGHCFNATCAATVLVADWKPRLAQRLQALNEQQHSSFADTALHEVCRPSLSITQPVLLLPPATPPEWQQQELQALLSLDEPMREALARSRRACAYLDERRIPLSIAQATGVGYLSPELLRLLPRRQQRSLLRRWTDRLLFPLRSPDGQGYIGRSLWRWVPGMDEHRHKSLLDRPGAAGRWIKTNPAGWFGYAPERHGRSIILVEGAFDRLALLAAGIQPAEIVALAGTAVRPDWVPGHVNTILLALDADDGGEHATGRLIDQLELAGLQVAACLPPDDNRGADWSERWRKLGRRSARPLLEARSALEYGLMRRQQGA